MNLPRKCPKLIIMCIYTSFVGEGVKREIKGSNSRSKERTIILVYYYREKYIENDHCCSHLHIADFGHRTNEMCLSQRRHCSTNPTPTTASHTMSPTDAALAARSVRVLTVSFLMRILCIIILWCMKYIVGLRIVLNFNPLSYHHQEEISLLRRDNLFIPLFKMCLSGAR